tara:strand:+ start:142 stop:1086 length:945 start_codon:yes stop_codon:yes gene_type:complete
MARVLYDFNTKNNSQSWNINAYRISSISGDDLILHPGSNSNIKIEGNIIPSISEKYNLGDINNKIRYIYVNQINGDVSGNLYGNASTSTKLERNIKIGGVDFTGEHNINLPGVNLIGNQNTHGNAATATRLYNSIRLGGIIFDGSKDISFAGVNIIGNQDTTGNAATASRLKDEIRIGGVLFDGEQDIGLPGVDRIGNQDTTGNAGTARRLKEDIRIAGVNFTGEYNINLPGVNMRGYQDTTGNAATASRLIDNKRFASFANISLKDDDINYVGLNHNFDGSLNNTQITNLTNDIVLIKEKLNAILRRQGLATF